MHVYPNQTSLGSTGLQSKHQNIMVGSPLSTFFLRSCHLNRILQAVLLHTVAQNLENAGKQGNLARNSTKLKDKLLGGYKNVLLIEEARKICVLARF